MNLVPHNDPILAEVQPEFTGDPATLHDIARAMHQIMVRKENPGIGMAAPQVGQRLRMFVMNRRSHFWDDARVCINPEIIETRGALVTEKEGCLTRPGLSWDVARSHDITVAYTNLQGGRVTNAFTGINARVFQHELDHLNGRTIWSKESA